MLAGRLLAGLHRGELLFGGGQLVVLFPFTVRHSINPLARRVLAHLHTFSLGRFAVPVS